MNPVIKNLLKRKNKKAPISDNKKIILVVFGGLMTGVRGAGAMCALQELGLTYAFDELYCISSGFANASYFLSYQGLRGISIYYEDLVGRKFLNPFTPLRIANIAYLISVMKTTKKLDINKVHANKTKLFIKLLNGKTKTLEHVEIHSFPKKEYLNLMYAATAVQYLHPGFVKVRNELYKDPPAFNNGVAQSHMKGAFSSGATDIVIIYNNVSQYKGAHGIVFPTDINILEIIPKAEWKLSRFETRSNVLKEAAYMMGAMTKELFGKKEGIKLK